MTLWFRKGAGMDTDAMRLIADEAAVNWNSTEIVYRVRGVGYLDGDESDTAKIQDAAEDLLGYRPQTYDPPKKIEFESE